MATRERDSSGRFTSNVKDKEAIEVAFIGLKTLIFYVCAFILILPWISIIIKNEVLSKTLRWFDNLIAPTTSTKAEPADGLRDDYF